MKNKHLNIQGFTLVELMITLLIAGILISYAVPSYLEFGLRQRVTNESNDLLGDIMFARVTAIKEGQSVTIASVSALDWSDGWNITLNASGDVVRAKQAIDQDVALVGTANSITFTNIGTSTAINAFTVSHPHSSRTVALNIALSGMVTSHD